MTEPTKTLLVSHLGGIEVGYRLSSPVPDRNKPTLVLFNPFTTTTDYYLPEFENKVLQDAMNLLAIEPLGHGLTRATKTESFTYWDSAAMALQLLDTLGVDKFFALGTSQGGWIAVRMALLAPQRAQGIILIGSSMDFESPKSRVLGCWDGPAACAGLLTAAKDLAPAHDFEPGDSYCAFLMDIGYGKTVDATTTAFWAKSIQGNYSGDDGKRRICMAAVALAGRDGLHERLGYVKCPVLWFQGDADVVFSLAQAQEDIKLFENSVDAKLVPCEGGVHFLSWTHKEKIHREVLHFIDTWKGSERAAL